MKGPFITLVATLAASLLGPSATAAQNLAQEVNQDGTGFAGAYRPSKSWQPPTDPAALAKLRKFQDLKFGIMYCWGLQTQFGTVDQSWCLCPERYDWNKRPAPYENADTLTFKQAYEGLQKTFNPVKFDPERDARIAEEAGAKYLVFCTKHHDGFCFFDTQTTDYKITSKACPFATNENANITKRLFDAFRKRNFWIGAYFSKADWNTPYYWAPQFGAPTSRNCNYSPAEHPEVWSKFKDLTWIQIRELMSDYGPVDILWLDGGQVQPRNGQDIDMPGLARMARGRQPGLLVVDRTAGGGCEDFLTPEGTHAMPESFAPDAWEACFTLGNHTWAWAKDSVYMSSGTFIRYLVKAVARNGNVLLGIGPDDHGEMDTQTVAALKQIGAWLKVNGEAIYGTRPMRPYESGNVFFTRKPDGTVYAIALSAKDGDPMPKRVRTPAALVQKGQTVTLVGGDGTPLAAEPAADGAVDIVLPEKTAAPCAAAWAFKLPGAEDTNKPVPVKAEARENTNGGSLAAAKVVPIDWSTFKPYGRLKPKPQELPDCAAIFLNSLAYNLSWATNAIEKLDGRMPFVGREGLEGRKAHDFIRPVSHAAFGLAVALQTGLYDEKVLGVPRAEARSRVARLIAGAAREHRGKGWGYPWQSSLWTADLGQGAWMLWDDLDSATRALVAGLVEWEADRLAKFVVPYWNGHGGDTKAEENAWDSMALSLAVAMMPNHPHAQAWKEKCSELMVSAYSTEADLQNERVLDGRPVKTWLHGFNANPDGSVVNHGFLHPDYMLCVQLNLRAFLVQPLARRSVPEAADFNAALVYRCLVTRQWPSPPYAAPGGTIYRPGEPHLYYPVRADWSRVNCVTAYLVDTHARALGLDQGLPHRAQDWMRVRAAKILEMQQRHPDHRIFADGELDPWPGREQSACGGLAAAFLALWLEAQHHPIHKANWLTGP